MLKIDEMSNGIENLTVLFLNIAIIGGGWCCRRGWPFNERRSNFVSEWSRRAERFTGRSGRRAENDDRKGDTENGPLKGAFVYFQLGQVSVEISLRHALAI